MENKLEKIILDSRVSEQFDNTTFGIVNFKKQEVDYYSYDLNKMEWSEPKFYFDLASVTKPLTIGMLFLLHPEKINNDLKLLLEHRAGLPSWSILSTENWKEQILSYEIRESETLYSDLGAIRAQLLFEKLAKLEVYKICQKYWDKEVCHWTELPDDADCLITGKRNKKEIITEVHDPNAFNIREKLAHAGLFATVKGLSKSLLNFNEKLGLLDNITKELNKNSFERFIYGWDRVTDLKTTLAGDLAGSSTFGHLGFTGTSIWLDPEKEVGAILLTNATKNYWYHKDRLNFLRKSFYNLIWSIF